jgi:hypothetical protein
MRETDADLAELQQVLDRSFAGAGSHLRSIFDEAHRLEARGIADALPGIFEMHLATLAGDGSPLVAPIDGIFFRGKVWFGLPGPSLRARLVKRDRRVSASYNASGLALIVHGTAEPAPKGTTLAAEFDEAVTELYVAQYGPGFIEWRDKQQQAAGPDEGFNGYIEPRVLFARGGEW